MNWPSLLDGRASVASERSVERHRWRKEKNAENRHVTAPGVNDRINALTGRKEIADRIGATGEILLNTMGIRVCYLRHAGSIWMSPDRRANRAGMIAKRSSTLAFSFFFTYHYCILHRHATFSAVIAKILLIFVKRLLPRILFSSRKKLVYFIDF